MFFSNIFRVHNACIYRNMGRNSVSVVCYLLHQDMGLASGLELVVAKVAKVAKGMDISGCYLFVCFVLVNLIILVVGEAA